jgi:hypothetical protein
VNSLRCAIEKYPFFGAAAGLTTGTVSFLEQLNVAIRVATGLVGLALAILSLMIAIRKYRKG